MKILNFGSCNIDYVYSLDHIVVPGETLSAKKREVFPGGKGLNQSVAAARAGAEVYHAGIIGADGEMLRAVLEESGADTRYLQTEDQPNGHAVIQVAGNAQNSIFLYEGTNGIVTKDYIDSVLQSFGEGDILLLQNEISNVPYLIQRGHEKGMTVVFNPAPFEKALLELDLGCVDYLILNEVEAAGFFGTEDVEGILNGADAWEKLHLVVTLGKKGCVYRYGTERFACPAFQVEAVDTTAAGDTFTGYFVSLIARGFDSRKAARYASAASALAVSAMGAAPSIPKMDRVEAAIKTLKPREDAEEGKRERLSRQILAYLRENLADAELSGLAASLGYSGRYMGSLLRETMGESFSDLLQRLRCEEAARLLRETERSVGEIIQMVGYKNESFFRQVFREFCGKTPLQYRKQWTGGTDHDQ